MDNSCWALDDSARFSASWRRRRRARLCASRWAFQHAVLLKRFLYDTLPAHDETCDSTSETSSVCSKTSQVAVKNCTMQTENSPARAETPKVQVETKTPHPNVPKHNGSETFGVEIFSDRTKTPQKSLKSCTEQTRQQPQQVETKTLQQNVPKHNGSEALEVEDSSNSLQTPQKIMKNCTDESVKTPSSVSTPLQVHRGEKPHRNSSEKRLGRKGQTSFVSLAKNSKSTHKKETPLRTVRPPSL